MFTQERYTSDDGVLLLRHHRGLFYTWSGTRWPEGEDRRVRADLYRWLESACYDMKSSPVPVPFEPTRMKVSNVVEAMQAVAHLDASLTPPAWIDTQGPWAADQMVAMANGLLHVPTRTLVPHTPTFFNEHALPFRFAPGAPEPVRWTDFLAELWEDDQESVDALGEVFGYILSGDLRQQKMFMVVGPKRSGKGTIARVLTGLLGAHNVAAPTLASLTTNFGLSPLVGRPLAVISDARLGTRADGIVAVERLLSISGEDVQTVDRKYRDPWTGRLPTRFLILTNELPRFTDSSGALASRFILFTLTRSFYGRENPKLTDELLQEAPGIFNWALEGLDRLMARGYFVQPASAREALQHLEDLSSPVGAFLRDRCDVGVGFEADKDALFAAWKDWCAVENLVRPGTKSVFTRNLRSAVPGLRNARPRVGGERKQLLEGLRLLDKQLTGPLTTPDQESPVRGPVRGPARQNRRSDGVVRGGQGSSALYPPHELDPAVRESILAGHRNGRTPEEIADAINGNGFEHPSGGGWTALDVRKVLEQEGDRGDVSLTEERTAR